MQELVALAFCAIALMCSFQFSWESIVTAKYSIYKIVQATVALDLPHEISFMDTVARLLL